MDKGRIIFFERSDKLRERLIVEVLQERDDIFFLCCCK